MVEELIPVALPESHDLQATLRILQEVDPSSVLFARCREILEGRLEIDPPIPKATSRKEARFLTIGMATYNDYDGCYFTLQSIRLHHPEILAHVEFLIIDNHPSGPCAKPLKALEDWVPNYRYVPCRTAQGTAVRDLIFREATGDFVLCVDCHVLFPLGALARLMEYCRSHPKTIDLLQGPLLSDGGTVMATQFIPKWSHGMYGKWAIDRRGKDAGAAPFEVSMQGLGVFACRREAWPGFNPRLSGFGGEEGYIHEKIRRAGGRTLCLPFLCWLHRFERPRGVPYPSTWADRIRNYLIIYNELNLDPTPVINHFNEYVGADAAGMILRTAAELSGPFHFFDGIYCINLDRQIDRWQAMQEKLRVLGVERGVRRFPAVETPVNHQIGRTLSYRRIIAEAKHQRLQTVLLFEDDVRFATDALDVLANSLRELEGRDWQHLYLGGCCGKSQIVVAGCPHLSVAGGMLNVHAVAFHHSVYDAILESVPDNAIDVARWLREHVTIDRFYSQRFSASSYLTYPAIVAKEGDHSVSAEDSRCGEGGKAEVDLG